MKLMALFLLFTSDLSALQSSFDHGKQVAESSKKGIEDQIKSGANKAHIPQYQDGVFINKEELSRSFEHLESDPHGRDLRDIHKTRKPYILDDTEDFMMRSENVHQHPEQAFEESEEVEEGVDSFTIETCEECPDEEYFVKARKTKKRYVYLQTPPYITAGQNCQNHGYLTIKVEIVSEPEEIFREDGVFADITHISTVPWGGAYIDETYRVNGVNVVLRKTIQQNGSPWIRPGCYLVPALQNHVVSAATMITKLLGGANDEYIHWGQIGNAYLHARVVNDTGEHYWILDDACQHYEELCKKGLCRYHSMEEDPPSDKYWKGKKVNGSWGQTVTYACRSSCKDTCAELRARGCSRQPDPECIEKIDGKCLRWRWKFKCRNRIGIKKHKFAKKNPFCLGGDCIDSSYESDRDMIQAMGYLSILEEARKEMDGTANINIFKGGSYACTRFPLSFKDCCGCGGWGVSMGLSGCDEDSKVVGRLRGEGKCVQVGTYCAEEINVGLAKFCLREKTVFCCFGTKFAKLLQEQGKPQLEISFGSPECPDCRGFTPDELSRIDFSKLDLTEITNDVMSRFKPQSGEHFAQEGELDRIREQMAVAPQTIDGDSPLSQRSQKAVSDISAMPIDQRRIAIADVIQKANSKKLLSEEVVKLQAYLDAIVPITPPTYSPTYHMEQVHEWIGGYSLWNQFATDPATGAKTFVQQHKLHTNEEAAYVTNAQNSLNHQATTKNAELKREYLQRIESQKSTPIPLEALTKVISATEIADMPVDQRILQKTPARKSSGSVEAQYLQENMRHLTGSLKPKGVK